MVKFVEVNPAEIETERLGRRGRVSYPLIKSFMEANIKVAKLDLTGFDKNPTYLRAVLSAYVKSHSLPIKIFSAQGALHLMRLDLNNDGSVNPEYAAEMATTEGAAGHLRDLEPVPLDGAEVAKRFAEEKGLITK